MSARQWSSRLEIKTIMMLRWVGTPEQGEIARQSSDAEILSLDPSFIRKNETKYRRCESNDRFAPTVTLLARIPRIFGEQCWRKLDRFISRNTLDVSDEFVKRSDNYLWSFYEILFSRANSRQLRTLRFTCNLTTAATCFSEPRMEDESRSRPLALSR